MSNPFSKTASTATATKGEAVAPPKGNLGKKDPFARPSGGGDGARIKEDVGSLLVIRMKEYKASVDTVHGETAAVSADWLVCDGENKGETRLDGLIFNRPLVRSLQDLEKGALFVGRLELGQAKPGKNAPYIFVDVDDDELPLARECAEAVGWL